MSQPDISQPQLFLDDTWIEDSVFVTRQWHQPRKHPDPVLVAEHPWERWCPVMFGTVLYHEERFKMWYCAWTREVRPRVCYAESLDGIEWEKPRIGNFRFQGSRANNIILESLDPDGLIDDITIIDDADDKEWPLKALFWDSAKNGEGHYGIHAARSKDGVYWDRSLGQVLPRWGDRFNAVSSQVNGRYVLFGRAPQGSDKGRVVWRIESEDLLNWSEPELVLASDIEDPPAMQYYSATAFPYSDIMLGSIERMHMSPDRNDTEIIWSRDSGHTWQRARTRPSFIPWGAERSWDDTWINLPTNGPIERRGQLWFYYSGRSGAHGAVYPSNHGGIGLAVLRKDGFASLCAHESQGYVMTPLMEWPEADLHVNVDPRRNLASHPGFITGEMMVEVRGEMNQTLEGFSREECESIRSNDVDKMVTWKEGRTAKQLAGRRIRFVFHLRDVHLYSFRAV